MTDIVSTTRVAAALLFDGTQILLGFRHPSRENFAAVWDIPGGHCEPGELVEETIRRELREELEVDAGLLEPVALLAWTSPEASAHRVEFSICLCEAWTGTPVNAQEGEHDRLAWFTLRQAAQLRLAHQNYPRLFRAIDLSLHRRSDIDLSDLPAHIVPPRGQTFDSAMRFFGRFEACDASSVHSE